MLVKGPLVKLDKLPLIQYGCNPSLFLPGTQSAILEVSKPWRGPLQYKEGHCIILQGHTLPGIHFTLTCDRWRCSGGDQTQHSTAEPHYDNFSSKYSHTPHSVPVHQHTSHWLISWSAQKCLVLSSGKVCTEYFVLSAGKVCTEYFVLSPGKVKSSQCNHCMIKCFHCLGFWSANVFVCLLSEVLLPSSIC